MERIPANPPVIEKVPEGTARPAWSVMIPVYNSGTTLIETLQSVLIQDTGADNMQIMVIDDCSDQYDIKSIVKNLAGERIEYFRKSQNEGHVQNFNTCIQKSRGQYIHILHADDKLFPGFYDEIANLFTQNPEAGAAFTRWEYVNNNSKFISNAILLQKEAGIVDQMLEKLTVQLRMQYVTTVVKRAVYEEIGGLYGVNYGEDWLMWGRIAAKYTWVYTPKILGQYREHALGSMSMNSIKDGSNITDIQIVMNKLAELLPESRKHLAAEGFRNYLLWTIAVMITYWSKTFDNTLVNLQINRVIEFSNDNQIQSKIRGLKLRMKFKELYKVKNFLLNYLRQYR